MEQRKILSNCFCNNLNDVLDGVSESFIIIVLSDLNVWIGDRKRNGITGSFGVVRKIGNGRKVIGFCKKRGIRVKYILEHKTIHKHMKVILKEIIDYVLAKMGILYYVLNVKSVRGYKCNVVFWRIKLWASG